MNCCGHCSDAGNFFNKRTAKRELRRYRRRGPNKSTHRLLNFIRSTGVQESTLLDIGGGIGAIPFELFREGLGRSVNVDASLPYQKISREEATSRGYADQSDYLYGDFVDLAEKLDSADIVTLDRVICCYPDAELLIQASADKTRKVLGVVYPRERLITKWGLKAGNAWFRLRKSEFRTYLHSPDIIRELIRRHALVPHWQGQTFLWHIETYLRNGSREH